MLSESYRKKYSAFLQTIVDNQLKTRLEVIYWLADNDLPITKTTLIMLEQMIKENLIDERTAHKSSSFFVLSSPNFKKNQN